MGRKPRVYKGGNHQRRKWCVGIGKGNPPYYQTRDWKEAMNYAIWWYVNKYIMPLG